MDYYLRFLKLTEKLEKYIIILTVLAIYILVFLQVFYRYILNASLFWAAPFARLALIWLTFFGASYAFKKGKHIKLLGFVDKFSPQIRNILKIFINIIILLTLIVLMIFGSRLFIRFLPTEFSGTKISFAYMFLPIVVSSFFMILTDIFYLIKILSKINVGNIDRVGE